MHYLIESGDLTKDLSSTANFCLLINDIFDVLNKKVVEMNNKDNYLKVIVFQTIFD